MAKMSHYCKAYPVEALRAFPDWNEKVPPLHLKIEPEENTQGEVEAVSSSEAEPTELDYYYIHDDYRVTAGIFNDENVAFDNVTDEWKEFCKNVFNLELPVYEPVEAKQEVAATFEAAVA